jgi:lambda family phage portal protein
MSSPLRLNLPPMSEVMAERQIASFVAHARASGDALARRADLRAQKLAELDRTLVSAQRAQRRAELKRTYDAAKITRLNSDWQTWTMSANGEIRFALRNVRARSRDLARNSDIMKRFLQLLENGVVGAKGIKLQAKARGTDATIDRALTKLVEDAFNEWGHKQTATVTGRLSWRDAQALFIRNLARDGEVLCRHMVAENRFAYSVKFIDPTYLDETHNAILPSGNRIIMGVEVNPDDKPVAYWLTTPFFDYYGNVTDAFRERIRVPAEEIIHVFVVTEGEEQTRGVPWPHATMQRMKDLSAYERAEVVAARAEASKMLFLKPPANDETAGVPPDDEEEEDAPLRDVGEFEPGLITELRPGWDAFALDPKHPKEAFQFFVKANLKMIASGLGCSYVDLANDLEAVSFSSIRQGNNLANEVWFALQGFTGEHFCRPVYLAWLKNAFLAGALDGVKAKDLQKLTNPTWRGRGFPYVNPLQDAQAALLEIRGGLATYSGKLAERGEDFEEFLATRQWENEAIAEAGLSFDLSSIAPTVNGAPPPEKKPAADGEDPAASE